MNRDESNVPSEHVDEGLLVRYLLGQLSETEEVQVEDRAFADADYLRALEAAETDLIDAWVRDELSQTERRAFERRFLTSPDRRKKVEFARALAVVRSESARPERPAPLPAVVSMIRGWSPALRLAAAFALLICVAGPSWLIVRNAVLEEHDRELQTQEQQFRRQLDEERYRAAAPPSIASLVLLPGLSRAETQVVQLVLTPTAQIVQIEIQLEARDDYPRFHAELRTRRGDEVLTRGNLTRRRTNAGYTVSFDVPASALTPGGYELSLKGVAGNEAAVDVGYYYFGVRKQ